MTAKSQSGVPGLPARFDVALEDLRNVIASFCIKPQMAERLAHIWFRQNPAPEEPVMKMNLRRDGQVSLNLSFLTVCVLCSEIRNM